MNGSVTVSGVDKPMFPYTKIVDFEFQSETPKKKLIEKSSVPSSSSLVRLSACFLQVVYKSIDSPKLTTYKKISFLHFCLVCIKSSLEKGHKKDGKCPTPIFH